VTGWLTESVQHSHPNLSNDSALRARTPEAPSRTAHILPTPTPSHGRRSKTPPPNTPLDVCISPMLDRSTPLTSDNIRAPPPGTKHHLEPSPRRRNKRARLIIIRIAISIGTHPLRRLTVITRTAAVRPVVLARAAVTRVPVFAAGRYAWVEGGARDTAVRVGVYAIAGR